MDQDFVARLMHVAQLAKSNGYEDVAAWMQKMLTAQYREERPRRRRGVKVRLPRINREITLDADRVKELARGRGGVSGQT